MNIRKWAIAAATCGAIAWTTGGVPAAQAAPAGGTQAQTNLLGIDVGLGLNLDLCDLGGQIPLPGTEELACVLDSLSYEYRTVYDKPGGGTIERTHLAVANLPSLLNVDADPLPDVVATLQVTSLDHFELEIDRLPTETGDLPALVEALVEDPTLTLPRDHVHLGYDARGAKAPKTWKGAIDLLETSDTTTKLGLSFTPTQAGNKLGVVGGLYDGEDGASKQDKLGAQLSYSPVPATTGATLTLVDDATDETRVEVTTPTATRLSAGVDIEEGDEDGRVETTVADLPVGRTTLSMLETGTDTGVTTYTSDGTVGAIDVDVKHRLSGALRDHTVIGLKNVPTKVTVEQTSKTTGHVLAENGAIGQAAVAFGTGREAVVPAGATRPYVRLDADGEFGDEHPASTALRVDRLQEVTYDLGEEGVENPPMEIDARFAPGTPLDMDVAARDDFTTVTGVVEAMPAHIHTRVDLGAGHIFYDGFGHTVKAIAVTAQASGGRTLIEDTAYDHVQARVDDLPPQVTIDIAPDGGKVDMTATAPVGQIQAELRKGTTSCLGELGLYESGAVVHDTPTLDCVAGRIDGLQEVHVTPEPLDLDVRTAEPQAFRVKARLDEAGDAIDHAGVLEAKITDLPSELRITRVHAPLPGGIDPGAWRDELTLRAKENIDEVKLTLDDMPGAADDVHDGEMTFTGVPKKLDVAIPTQGTVKKIDADTYGEGLGLVAIDLRTATDGTPAVLDPGKDIVSLRDGWTALRIHDLEEANILAPYNVAPQLEGTIDAFVRHSAPAKPFELFIDTDELTGWVKLPTAPQVMHFKRRGTYALDGSRQPEQIDLQTNEPVGTVELRLRTETVAIAGSVAGLDAHTQLCMWTGNGGLHSDPNSIDPTMCYRPNKTRTLAEGGDPFVVYDNVQIYLNDLAGGKPTPYHIPLLRICADPTGPTAQKCFDGQEPNRVTVENLTTGELKLAAGTGVIYPCDAPDHAQMATLYGDLWDSGACDEAYKNEGMHLWLDTDDNGLLVDNLEVVAPDNPGNEDPESYFRFFRKYSPMKGDLAIRAADMNFPPLPGYSQGSLSCPDADGTDMQLETPTIEVDEDLISYVLDCAQ